MTFHKDCDAKWCAAYLGISDIHLKDKLRISREEALNRAVETVEYAKSHGLKIRFTVEDGSRAEPEFLLKVCKAIEEVGVDQNKSSRHGWNFTTYWDV